MPDQPAIFGSRTFQGPSGGGGGGEGMHLSTCGGLVLDVGYDDWYMVWSGDGTEPTLTPSGGATADIFEFNATAGMYFVQVGTGGTLLIGTGGAGPEIAALKITDHQYHCT